MTAKAMLGLLAVLLLAAFLYWLMRELSRDLLVRRSRKGRVVSQNIPCEYPHRDSPAWQRVQNTGKAGRRHRVELALRELGE